MRPDINVVFGGEDCRRKIVGVRLGFRFSGIDRQVNTWRRWGRLRGGQALCSVFKPNGRFRSSSLRFTCSPEGGFQGSDLVFGFQRCRSSGQLESSIPNENESRTVGGNTTRRNEKEKGFGLFVFFSLPLGGSRGTSGEGSRPDWNLTPPTAFLIPPRPLPCPTLPKGE